MLIKKVKYQDENAISELGFELKNIIDKDTIVVCIGTDKCIGDSLAPFVGTYLKESNFPLKVYGTLDKPIHALNLESKIQAIKEVFPDSRILGIDACLSEEDEIGDIKLRDTPILAGKGAGKSLPKVGNNSIAAIVSHDFNDFLLTSNIRLSLITNMAKTICDALCYAVKL